MPRILITGSAQGLGRAAADDLLADGHQVVVHARNHDRAATLDDLTDRGATVVVADLSSVAETRRLADEVNRLGRMDAVIHNAGIYGDDGRRRTADGHPAMVSVNLVAPYLLTCLLDRPDRIIYLTSDMQLAGDDSDAAIDDLDWERRRWNSTQAYRDTKLFGTALAFAIARRWPEVVANAVDPGWVPTRMGGPAATDDLRKGHLTQVWLATSTDPEARRSGHVWHHHRHAPVAAAATRPEFQDRVLARLAELTGTPLPDGPAWASAGRA